MKPVVGFFAREYVIVGILTVVILVLSLLPTFLKMLDAPAGRGFFPVHNSLSDYPFYTSIIKQGLEGSPLVWGRFTSEPQDRGVLIHYLYLMGGWAGRVFGFTDANLVYHVMRIVLGGMWIIVIYILTARFTKGKTARLTAFFLALYSAGWPVATDYNGVRVLWWPMNWWSEFDPRERAAFIPHYLAGHIFMALSFLVVSRARVPVPARRIFLMSVLLFAAAFIHPPSYIIVAMSVPVWLVLSGSWKILGSFIPAFVAGFIPLLIIKREFTVFPWVLSESFEGLSFALSIPEYLGALGPVVFLGAIGAVIRRRDRKAWLLMLWFGISLVMLQLIRYFPFSPIPVIRALAIANTRFLQVAPWIPLAILSGSALSFFRKKYGNTAFILLSGVLVIVTFAGYPQSVRFQREKVYGAPQVTWPTAGYMDAIMSLRGVTAAGDVVWSLPLAGEMIPIYANRIVYTGNHEYSTFDLKRKMDTAYGLYHGNVDTCTIFKEMKSQRVKAVFYGWDEQNAAGDKTGDGSRLRKIPFLMPWKDFGDTSIFLFVDAKPVNCH